MKAITLTQPWATLVVIGAKKFETRSWSVHYRGPLLIHAARSLGRLSQCQYEEICQSEPFAGVLDDEGKLPFGALLGLVQLEECSLITAHNAPPSPELDFGDYTPGRFMWKLGMPVRFRTPIPTGGLQGLWEYKGKLREYAPGGFFK